MMIVMDVMDPFPTGLEQQGMFLLSKYPSQALLDPCFDDEDLEPCSGREEQLRVVVLPASSSVQLEPGRASASQAASQKDPTSISNRCEEFPDQTYT